MLRKSENVSNLIPTRYNCISKNGATHKNQSAPLYKKKCSRKKKTISLQDQYICHFIQNLKM